MQQKWCKQYEMCLQSPKSANIQDAGTKVGDSNVHKNVLPKIIIIKNNGTSNKKCKLFQS